MWCLLLTFPKLFQLVVAYWFHVPYWDLLLKTTHANGLWCLARVGGLSQCASRNKRTQPHIYVYPFSPGLPSHPGCHMTLSRVPVLYSRSLSVFRFKYSSVYMLILNYPFPLFFLIPPSVSSFCKSVSLFLIYK